MASEWWTFEQAPAPSQGGAPQWPPAFPDSDRVLLWGSTPLPYRRVASPRARSLGIRIDPKQGVIVRDRRRPSQKRAEEYLRASQRWLRRALRREALRQSSSGLTPVPDGPISWRGIPYTLRARIGAIRLTEDPEQHELQLWAPALHPQALAQALEQEGRSLARQRVQTRLQELGKRTGLSFARIRIGDMSTRWASCSPRRTLSITWRIVALSDELLDYLLVHELTHLLHANHGPTFWAQVQAWCPQARELDSQLGRTWVW